MNKNKKSFSILCIGLLVLTASVLTTFGQTCVNMASPSTITENFDSLANTGTTNTTYPTGFAASANNGTDYRAGTGSDTAGDIYSFGAAASTERALGSLASGSTATVILGGCFTNTSGQSLGSITIRYTGEQWREGNTTLDTLTFQYSTNATSITDGAATWVPVTGLNFNSPVNGGNTGTLNGNTAANRTTLNSTIAVAVPNTTSFYFRWLDANDAGNDNGMGVDDFALSALANTAAPGSISGRARNSIGSGIKHAVLMLTGGNLDEPLYATTNQFGIYQFEDVPVGQTYVLQITSGRYTFQNPSRVINLEESLTNEDFLLDEPTVDKRRINQKDDFLIQRKTSKRP